MLKDQIKILVTKTSDFQSNHENHLDSLKYKLSRERRELLDGYSRTLKDGSGKARKITGLNEIKKRLEKDYGYDADVFKTLEKDEISFGDMKPKEKELCNLYLERKGQIENKAKKIRETKNKLLQLLENKVNSNMASRGKDHIRILNHNEDFPEENIIAVFDSAFSRIIGASPNELTYDFMEIQVYYFDVIKDLINFGFMYKGEKYIYFTSSAGQIRTKKCVFIKESVWNRYEKTIMCGLTVDSINAKGGCNPNKYLAYLALTNSATDVWSEFDIDKAIVIDDFETEVYGTYDLIDDKDYSIKRISDYVPIPHTDGAGMMLPCMGKNRMVRLPWIKGLLGVFDYKKFIEVNNCSPIIKDIYGKEHDVIAEDIQVIFTKSQFKMWKYYDSWEQYKKFYKQYGCSAAFMNEEADRIKNATINYQMLQTLTDITDEEIQAIAKDSVDRINNLCSDVNNILEAFGITPYNTEKTPYQKAIQLYPDLMNDEFFKSKLRELKDSIVKKCKAGHLRIRGKYTFVLPDFYAACEYWFCDIKNPKGLLNDGEVFCWLFRKAEKLDCLRSPHLYREHAIRKNQAYRDCKNQKKLREWFTTDAIYTSTHDLISKVLQFDVDGDVLLVVADKNIIDVAERNMKNIVPLYYNMKKASDRPLDKQVLYDGLNAAFTGGNIGTYSNDISKIWNNEVFISGSDEDKQHALDCIKRLCCQNNFVIDYAKTLYKPEFPKDIQDEIKLYTKAKLPHFFTYAKDKEKCQIADANNSLVNRLQDIIPNPRINTRKLELDKIDHTLLMSNPDIEISVKDELITKYRKLNKELGFDYISSLSNKINNATDSVTDMSGKDKLGNSTLFYQEKIEKARLSLADFGSPEEIVDMLVTYLYKDNPSRYKNLLWTVYGDTVLKNLQTNIKKRVKDEKKKRNTYGKIKSSTKQTIISTKDIVCEDCGEWFTVSFNDRRSCRCEKCKKERLRNQRKEYMRKKREKEKAS